MASSTPTVAAILSSDKSPPKPLDRTLDETPRLVRQDLFDPFPETAPGNPALERLLTSASTLPARRPLRSSKSASLPNRAWTIGSGNSSGSAPSEDAVRVDRLLSRSFVLQTEDFTRLQNGEPLRVESVELSAVQDRSGDETSMERVFAFRILPGPVASAIQKHADWFNGPSGHVPWQYLRALSLFGAVKVCWNDLSASPGHQYYTSMRPGHQVSAILTHKTIEGDDRLLVSDFEPILRPGDTVSNYLTPSTGVMTWLRNGQALHVRNLQLADRHGWTDPSGEPFWTFVFRVLPQKTRQIMTANASSRLNESGSSFLPWRPPFSRPLINAVMSVPKSQCPSGLSDLDRGQAVSGVLQLKTIGSTSRLCLRSARPQEETNEEASSGHSSSVRRPQHLPSTNPGTPSPQVNDEWHEIDGTPVHRDQL